MLRPDPLVISNDASVASRFAHLVGSDYGELYEALLIPRLAIATIAFARFARKYTPLRLNFVVNGEGRIIAIGCF